MSNPAMYVHRGFLIFLEAFALLGISHRGFKPVYISVEIMSYNQYYQYAEKRKSSPSNICSYTAYAAKLWKSSASRYWKHSSRERNQSAISSPYQPALISPSTGEQPQSGRVPEIKNRARLTGSSYGIEAFVAFLMTLYRRAIIGATGYFEVLCLP